MSNHLFYLFWINSIPHIVEVALITLSILWKISWEVLCHSFFSNHLVIEVFDSNLIKGWHIHKLDFTHLKQILIPLDDILEKVFRYLMIR